MEPYRKKRGSLALPVAIPACEELVDRKGGQRQTPESDKAANQRSINPIDLIYRFDSHDMRPSSFCSQLSMLSN
jgi:hypothetical protein